jgi:5-methylcytosine-specific restriction endonuclease McrA
LAEFTSSKLARTSRGGDTSWENCVLAHRSINSRKADRTPGEAGFKLLRAPKAPKELPTNLFISNAHDVADWAMFIE